MKLVELLSRDTYRGTPAAKRAQALLDGRVVWTGDSSAGKLPLAVANAEFGEGRFGKALAFAPSGGHCEAVSPRPIETTLRALTVEVWLRRGSGGGTVALRESQFGLRVDKDGEIEAALGDTESWQGGGGVTGGEWTHVAASWNGSRVRLFVGGKKTAEFDAAGPVAPPGMELPLWVGGIGTDTGARECFSGSIDELRVSSSARYADSAGPPEETFSPDEATLCLWHLDGPVGE
jgi:hypothetical protein